MKSFLLKTLIFSFPVLIYCSLIVVSDPYNYFNLISITTDNIKKKNIKRSAKTTVLGNVLFKTHEFSMKPCPNIILGDSREFLLNSDTIGKLSGLKYFNFGIPGGNYKTICSLFWYSKSKIKLKNVYITIGLHNYVKDWGTDLYGEAMAMDKNIYPYFTAPLLVNEAFYHLKIFFINRIYTPLFSQKNKKQGNKKYKVIFRKVISQKDWDQKKGDWKNNFVRWHTHPDDILDSLTKIAEYCKKNDIKLVFIMVPYQEDYHNLVKEAKLEEQMLRFKSDFCRLGEVFDFDYENEITQDRALFRDLFHANDSIYGIMCEEIWGGKKGIAKHYLPESVIKQGTN